jgi:hypothetical protein
LGKHPVADSPPYLALFGSNILRYSSHGRPARLERRGLSLATDSGDPIVVVMDEVLERKVLILHRIDIEADAMPGIQVDRE